MLSILVNIIRRSQIVFMLGKPTVFTIGHSTHESEQSVALLKQHQIDAVADVRSMPYSRRQPQFSRERH